MRTERRKRFLVVTLSNIGDVILTTPVIMALRQADPAAELTVVCGPKAETLLAGSRKIDRLVIYDKRARLFFKFKFLLSLYRGNYDLAIDLRNSAIPYLVPARKRSPFYRKFSARAMRERHLEVLRMTGLKVPEKIPVFDFFSDTDRISAVKKTGCSLQDSAYCVISAGAASEGKRWPLDCYAGIIEKLLAFSPGEIFLSGDANEREYVNSLCELSPGRIFNAAGRLTLRETAALIGGCRLLVSNDSAAMHLGHEMNRPVVAVFGPTDPSRYGRHGGNFRVVAPEGGPSSGFEGVSVERVWEACGEVLKPQGRSNAAK